MRGNAIETLKQQLATIEVNDEQGWLEYVPLAARLAAFGEPTPLARRTKLVEPFRDQLESLLVLAQPCPVVEVSWPPLVSPLLAAEALAQYDSGCPSDRLKQHFERLDFAVELPDSGRLAVSRRIDDCWRVVIDLRPWEHIQRTRLMDASPLVIGFRNGYRLRLSIP